MICLQGIQKLTLLDYPGRVACTLFTGGCNFRCPFCQNSELLSCRKEGSMNPDEVLAFLEQRRKKGLLDGVCITGGEPLLQEGIAEFLQKLKQMGYAVKLDTNGSFPDKLQELIDAHLVDYVAMDIKNSLERYAETSGTTGLYNQAVERSVELLKKGLVPYEFRTTVVKEFHDAESMQQIALWISGAERYYLQSFVDSDQVLETGLHAYEPDELEELRRMILAKVPSAKLRGVDLSSRT